MLEGFHKRKLKRERERERFPREKQKIWNPGFLVSGGMAQSINGKLSFYFQQSSSKTARAA
jgi:hypothetical protein